VIRKLFRILKQIATVNLVSFWDGCAARSQAWDEVRTARTGAKVTGSKIDPSYVRFLNISTKRYIIFMDFRGNPAVDFP
jgi:hypothetical protein